MESDSDDFYEELDSPENVAPVKTSQRANVYPTPEGRNASNSLNDLSDPRIKKPQEYHEDLCSHEAQEHFEKMVRELEQEERKITYMTAERGRGPAKYETISAGPCSDKKKKFLTAMVYPYGWHQEGPCHDPLPVGILHAAHELRVLDEDAAEVIINTKLKLNFEKLN